MRVANYLWNHYWHSFIFLDSFKFLFNICILPLGSTCQIKLIKQVVTESFAKIFCYDQNSSSVRIRKIEERLSKYFDDNDDFGLLPVSGFRSKLAKKLPPDANILRQKVLSAE